MRVAGDVLLLLEVRLDWFLIHLFAFSPGDFQKRNQEKKTHSKKHSHTKKSKPFKTGRSSASPAPTWPSMTRPRATTGPPRPTSGCCSCRFGSCFRTWYAEIFFFKFFFFFFVVLSSPPSLSVSCPFFLFLSQVPKLTSLSPSLPPLSLSLSLSLSLPPPTCS